MSEAGGPLLSVRAEARQLAGPDYAVLDGLIESAAESKPEAVKSAAALLDRLTADLTGLGGAPFDQESAGRPLTWSAHSSTTRQERYHDKATGRIRTAGEVTATVALRLTVRDLAALDAVSAVLAAHPGLNVHAVSWHVDWDNPAWQQVRAAAIQAAIRKARDYAAALGGAVRQVEHVADVGLLGADGVAHHPVRSAARAMSAAGEPPETVALDPVPQELAAAIEARFRLNEVSLPPA